MKYLLYSVPHTEKGFATLARLHACTNLCSFEEIEVDLRNMAWIDAEMCSALGAILHHLANRNNSIILNNMAPKVRRILARNGFLSHYGRDAIPDRWGTTIFFNRFDVEDFRFFDNYLETEFIHHPELPQMSPALLEEFRRSLFEIFNNSVPHSQSQMGVFSCGQFFPAIHRLNFCLTDLGVGIHKNVCSHLKQDLGPEESIEWATQGYNTTKRGNIPGGLGLKLLREFIDLNEGSIQIVSEAGYWERRERITYKARMAYPFPGTIVNLEINTADRNSYGLATDLLPDDIF